MRRGRKITVGVLCGMVIGLGAGCSVTKDDTPSSDTSTHAQHRNTPASSSPSASARPTGDPRSPTPAPDLTASPPTRSPLKTTSLKDGREVTAEINSLSRSSTGLTTLVWTIKNDDKDTYNVLKDFDDSNTYEADGVSAVTLRDGVNKVDYHTVMASDRTPLASNLRTQQRSILKQGDEIKLFAMFRVQDNAKKVDINLPGFENVKSVPITG